MGEPVKPAIDASELARAIASDELRLVYQPKIALRTHSLAGVEALTRWRHPRLGNIPPADFIPLAEETGLINALTEWAVCTAAEAWTAWTQDGLTTKVAVNVSAKSLDNLELPDIIEAICRRKGMPSKHLIIELTESATSGPVELLDIMTRFRIKNFEISMDDFGTGYSSLGYLQSFRFDKIKIDRSFVSRMGEDANANAIVRAVVAMTEALGVRANAEGVETAAQANALRAAGCAEAQGYLYSRPVPGDVFDAMMRESVGGYPPVEGGDRSVAVSG